MAWGRNAPFCLNLLSNYLFFFYVGLKEIRLERFSCMPILSTRLGMMYVCRDLPSTSGHHGSRKQSTLPGCTWDMHFPLQPYENAESQPAFPSRRLSFEQPPTGWLVKEAEHSRCINDFECALYATRPSRRVSLVCEKKRKKRMFRKTGKLLLRWFLFFEASQPAHRRFKNSALTIRVIIKGFFKLAKLIAKSRLIVLSRLKYFHC